jgi:uncharacterized protein
MLVLLSIIYFNFHKSVNFRPDYLVFYLGTCFVLFYVPKLFIASFQLFEDVTRLIAWIMKSASKPETFIHIKACQYLKSFVIGKIGVFFSIIPLLSIIYGIALGRYNFEVKNVVLPFKNLPEKFDGFKILQFSDFHSGSLINQQGKFKKAFELINLQNPDIIVFTGDMVNSSAYELEGWVDLLAGLKAKHGKFSILGNHDYGDYRAWNSVEEKVADHELLKAYQKKMGFTLLLNQSCIIERDSQAIALLGIENWGEKPFPQYGRLDLALNESKNIPFKILLSHDPSLWKAHVAGKTDIALTLSGHTHGMQLAINIGDFSWSPVSLKYPEWKGIYSEKGQYLYVNIGLGYIGFPGRVGTNPEITVFELKHE